MNTQYPDKEEKKQIKGLMIRMKMDLLDRGNASEEDIDLLLAPVEERLMNPTEEERAEIEGLKKIPRALGEAASKIWDEEFGDGIRQ